MFFLPILAAVVVSSTSLNLILAGVGLFTIFGGIATLLGRLNKNFFRPFRVMLGNPASPGVPATKSIIEQLQDNTDITLKVQKSIEDLGVTVADNANVLIENVGRTKNTALVLDQIKKEVLPNGGTSLADAVRRTEAGTNKTSKKLVGIEDQLEDLRGTLSTHILHAAINEKYLYDSLGTKLQRDNAVNDYSSADSQVTLPLNTHSSLDSPSESGGK